MAGGGLDRTSVDVLDLNSQTWRVGTPLPVNTAWAKAAPYGDTFLMMGGGSGAGDYYDTVYEYDVEGQAWILRNETMHHGKYDSSAVLMDTSELTCQAATPPVQ